MERTEGINQLFLHIFIGSMVLVRDFYPYFNTTKEPAVHESQLAVEFMGYFSAYCAELAGEKGEKLIQINSPLIVKKINSEIGQFLPRDFATAAILANHIKKYQIPSAADELLASLASRVGNETIQFHAYAAERIADMQYKSVPFKQLVDEVKDKI